MHKVAATQPNLFNDIAATLLVHHNLCTDGYKIFQRRMLSAISLAMSSELLREYPSRIDNILFVSTIF